ncbi:hypothetical protein BH23CHL9_BH23CHL9_06580 [soil metagenome]
MSLEDRLRHLEAAAGAARSIGLDEPADAADAIVQRARERAGFPGDAYVMALAGGTGVGKSSVLNALAGRTVSAVRAIRPTTDEPLAWVADGRRGELAPLLEWLGVRHQVAHADGTLEDVAILDLPDVDSVRTEHRARVDELLPRIDAITWVVDPEKYDDERLHAYLRSLRDHAPRMRFVLNKIDRVPAARRADLVADVERRIADSGIPDARVHAVSALDGHGIDALRADVAAEADAKALIAAKLASDAHEATLRLADALSVKAGTPYEPLLPETRVADATREAARGAQAIMDPTGLARQVQAAVLGRARRSGGSMLSRIVVLLTWMTGRQRTHADPAGYLRDWRRRGSLGRVLNPVAAVFVEASARVPASSRHAILRSTGAGALEASVSQALDGVAREAASDLAIPRSLLWPLIGAVQLFIGAIFALAVAWYVTLFLAQGQVPVAVIEIVVLGPVPLPLVLLAGSVLASAVLGFVLSLHAGWIGRRLGRRLAIRVTQAVTMAIGAGPIAALERIEAVRRDLADALAAN